MNVVHLCQSQVSLDTTYSGEEQGAFEFHTTSSDQESLAGQLSIPRSTPDSEHLIQAHCTPLPRSVRPSFGWNGIPLECLEIIVQVLDDDTTTLSSLLQVNRQCFFVVVPRLYRDPFQRIRELANRHSNRIRLSSDKTPPTTTATSLSKSQDTPEDLTANATPLPKTTEEIIDEEERTKAKSRQDTDDISTIFATRFQEREFQLLTTLLSTLIQRLCLRFPKLHSFYYGQHTHKRFDFGPYHRQVQWTSEYYLRHFAVLDLEKLSARGRRRGGPGDKVFLESVIGRRDLVPTTGKEGVFHRRFSVPWWSPLCCIGALDYLQRALLNIPGADRIQTLRIPAHRMKTFLKRQDRIPVTKKREEESEQQHVEGAIDEQEGDRGRTGSLMVDPGAFTEVVDESLRPYCFTFNKLSNLRRLEVTCMTWNDCDWETLDRVLEILRNDPKTPESSSSSRPCNRIREFSLQTQSPLDDKFTKLLRHFDYLEVLEVQARCYQQHIWIDNWNPKLYQSLKSLRMSVSTLLHESMEILGRLTNLEELRLTVDVSCPFQWIANTKAEIRRRTLLEPQHNAVGPVKLICSKDGGNNEFNSLNECLPKLRQLGIGIKSNSPVATIHNTCEAFADQLEELVIWAQHQTNRFSFQLPFRHLRRLAIRGYVLFQVDFASLLQQCPTVEQLALQHTYFVLATTERQSPDCEAMIACLKQLPRLRCLYLEGLWDLNDNELLELASESPSLYRIGINECKGLTLDGCHKVDAVLSQRETKYPLKRKGLYRLPKIMSGFLAKDFSWRIAYFGHEDD
ncbi:hypothetical protein BGX31_001794 [Mortierella sp. GBA43]|nr:hypothetical protein BGX31_001794 [Mortierella sp. GBA43]